MNFETQINMRAEHLKTIENPLLNMSFWTKIQHAPTWQGCMQLHGPAKSFQLAKMSYENKAAMSTGEDDQSKIAENMGKYGWNHGNLWEINPSP